MSAKGLTERERRFVEAYCVGSTAGNAASSVRAAGYAASGANVTGSRMLKRPNVKAAVVSKRATLASIEAAETKSLIATKVALQEFWTRIINDDAKAERRQDQLKASELMGKSLGVFVEAPEPTGPTTINQVNILSALPVEALRALMQAARQ